VQPVAVLEPLPGGRCRRPVLARCDGRIQRTLGQMRAEALSLLYSEDPSRA
jgi:hypothetical protein